MKSPQVKDKLAGLGAKIATPSEMTPEYLADLVKSEIAKWAVPIKASASSSSDCRQHPNKRFVAGLSPGHFVFGDRAALNRRH